MKKDKELRKKMADMFEGLEAEPQAETWQNIRAAITEKKERKWVFWKMASLLIFLLCGISGYFMFMLKKQHEPNAQQGIASKITKPFEKGEKEYGKMETKKTNLGFKGLGNKKISIINTPQTEKSTKTLLSALNIRVGGIEKIFSQLYRTNIDSIKNQNWRKLIEQISDAEVQEQLLVEEVKELENDKKQGNREIYLLDTRKINILQKFDFQLLTEKTTSYLSQISPFKKKYFSANVSLLSNFQLMEAQKNELYSIATPQLLPTFDAKRLGISTNFAYNHVFSLKNEIALGVNAAAIPQNFAYQIQNNHIYKVKFAQNGEYSIERQASFYQKREYLMFFGGEIMYRYHFLSAKNSPISLIMGAAANFEMRHKQPYYWLKAGFDIRLNRHFHLSPVLQYQLNQTLNENALMKTRFYNLGIGATYKFY